MKRSQSLEEQGVIQTIGCPRNNLNCCLNPLKNRALFKRKKFYPPLWRKTSQSLEEQGVIQTLAEYHVRRDRACLNPLKNRALFKPSPAGHNVVTNLSQSLEEQGVIQTKRNQRTRVIGGSQSLEEQGVIQTMPRCP